MIRRAESQGLQIVFIPRPPEVPGQPLSIGRKPAVHAARLPAQRPDSGNPLPVQQAPQEDDNAIQAPIDWAAELSRAAKNAAADKSAPTPRDFGFPHLPAAPAKMPHFDWDYAATHRVEQIEGGGLLVHLDDRCVVVFLPFPFIFCGIGTKPANGELFKNMRDPAAASETP